MRPALALLFALAAATPSAAAQSIVTDLATTPTPGDSAPLTYHALGTQTLFLTAEQNSYRLWSSDGTAAGTVQLREWPAPLSGVINTAFVQLGNELLFAMFDSGVGYELWKTDGTTAGTVLVKDIYPGTGSSIIFSVAGLGQNLVISGVLYFVARDGVTGFELWRTDGTTAGTQLVIDLEPGPGGSMPHDGLAHNGELYFFADDGPSHQGLFKSDGTANGTSVLHSFQWPLGTSGPYESLPGQLASLGNKLFFKAPELATGYELWSSDGTPSGTTLFADLNPSGDSSPTTHSAMGNVLFFSADTGGGWWSLFRTDGTPAGTFELHPNSVGTAVPTAPNQMTFLTGFPGAPTEIWNTDGSVAGTHFVMLEPAPWMSNLIAGSAFTAFTTWNINGKRSLWRTDGTVAGTLELVELDGIDGFDMGSFSNGELWFNGTTATEGREPWLSSGTKVGTQMAVNLTPELTADSNPTSAVVVGDDAYFVANPSGTSELFVTDGTAAGTQALMPYMGAKGYPISGAALHGKLLFSSMQPGEIWESDGTPAGTQLAIDLSTPTPPITYTGNYWNAGDHVFFTAKSSPGAYRFWVTDGTPAGTYSLDPLLPSSSPGVELGGLYYFFTNDQTTGTELWVSDGTPPGTSQIVDLEPGPLSSLPNHLTRFGSKLYFAAKTTAAGRAIWSTDGLGGSTAVVFDLAQGSNPGDFVRGIAATSSDLFFLLHKAGLPNPPGKGDDELWVSDGTTSGTTLLKSFPSPLVGGTPSGGSTITATPNRVYFFAGSGLWTSDGTSTIFLQSFDHWNDSLSPFSSIQWNQPKLSNASDSVVFFASEAASGAELWVSDGTPAGTYPISDPLNPGAESSDPDFIVRRGNQVLFSGNDPLFGRELIQIPLTSTGGFVFETFGTGCAGPSGLVPELELAGKPQLTGSLSIAIKGAPSSEPAFLFYSGATAPSSAGACTLLIAGPQSVIATATSPAGTASITFTIPSAPALIGAESYAQWVVLDAGAITTSAALELVIGQ